MLCLGTKMQPAQIGEIVLEAPVIMGGMAVRIGGPHTAARVSSEGGLGVIGVSGMGAEEAAFSVKLAKTLSGGSPVGVNIMEPMNNFSDVVKQVLCAGVDVLIVSAGISRECFRWASACSPSVPVVPVVSSVKGAIIFEHLGASALVVEGVSGGHQATDRHSLDMVCEIVSAVSIPVFLGGEIIDGYDIYQAMSLGATGVQMGSCFATAREIVSEDGVSSLWQEQFLSLGPDDLVLIESPAGLPFRADKRSPMVQQYLVFGVYHMPEGPRCPVKCLRNCRYRGLGNGSRPFTSHFCIYEALNRARNGDLIHGTITAGPRAWEIERSLSVYEIFEMLKEGYSRAASAAST